MKSRIVAFMMVLGAVAFAVACNDENGTAEDDSADTSVATESESGGGHAGDTSSGVQTSTDSGSAMDTTTGTGAGTETVDGTATGTGSDGTGTGDGNDTGTSQTTTDGMDTATGTGMDSDSTHGHDTVTGTDADTGTGTGHPGDTATQTAVDSHGSDDPFDTVTEDARDTETGTIPVDDSETTTGSTPGKTITVSLESNAVPRIIYVIWLENEAHDFVQHIYVCGRLTDNSLTGIALPYWYINKKDLDGEANIDAVTGATITPEFSVQRALATELGTKFTVYVEVDHSFDDNDWFENQPALIYAADVDLAAPLAEYHLEPVGWARGRQNTCRSIAGGCDADEGELISEMRYITNHADNGGFGDPDERSATGIVDYIMATID